jgi:cytochrome c556
MPAPLCRWTFLTVSASALALAIGCASTDGKDAAPKPPSSEPMRADGIPLPPRGDLQGIMRAKAAWAAALLEAVSMRDYALVEQNAEALRQLSLESRFVVQDTVAYRASIAEFRSSVTQLATAAEAKDQEAVEAAYHRVTQSCFHCHALVRGERIGSGMPGRVSLR